MDEDDQDILLAEQALAEGGENITLAELLAELGL